jgi:methyl-accepting chemotaxis protein
MTLLLQLSIRTRLVLLVAVTTIAMLAAEAFTLYQAHHELLAEQEAQTRQLAEVVTGIADHYYKRARAGAMTEEQAKQTAIDIIRDLRHSGQEYFWINDMNAVMVMHPMKPQLNNTSVADMRDANGKYMFREFVDAVQRNGEGMVAYEWTKPGQTVAEPKVSYVKGFKPWGWVIGTGIYISDVDAAFRAGLLRAGLRLGLIVAIITGLALLIVTSIVRPLRETGAAMEDIASGEGDLTRRLEVKGSDELAALAGSFNRFVDKVHATVRQVADATSRLATAAEELGAVTRTTREAVEHQQAETDQVATAMNQMTATVQEVAKSSNDAAQNAHQAHEVAEDGHRLVDEARHAIEGLSGEVQTTAAAVGHLEEEVNRIGTVLEVIRGVAEQTNLLALNAAIEAARAGEQGRGFAVVADEVRTLAARTQASTLEIQSMIDALRSGAQQAVSSMGSSRALTESTVQKAEAAAQALERIAPTVGRISDMSAQIASAAQEQEAVAKNIDQNVIQIASEAEQAAAAAEEVARASAKLAELGEELRTLVRQFKV